MTIQVSVVVPTFKRPHLLRRCLSALLTQNFDPAAYEIIVVDDAAWVETKKLVEGWAEPGVTSNGQPSQTSQAGLEPRPGLINHPQDRLARVSHAPTSERGGSVHVQRALEQLMVMSPPRQDPLEHSGNGSNGASSTPLVRYLATAGTRGPAAARNLGWRAARGQIIAFTDDDCAPEPDWLSAGVSTFTDEIMGVGGWVSVPLPDTPTDYERSVAGLQGIQVITANCFYRREVLAAVGGFDERFTMAWREDSDIFFSLLEHYDGDSWLAHAPKAIVVHSIRPAPWGVSLSQQRKSMFNALLYKKHPALYRELIQPAPPWRYYRVVAVLLVALGSMAGGYQWLALAAMGLWLFLTGHFCGQRLYGTSHAPQHIAEMVVTSALIPPLAIFWRLRGALKFRVFFL